MRVTKHAKHIADGLKLKAALDKLVRAEIDDDPDVEELRQQLNQLHNEFIINYGRLLNRRDHPNSLEVFADDSELVTLCYALEEEIPADIDLHTGKIKSVRYKKADIFTQRVSGKLRKSDRTINNAMDAVKMSLDRKGYLDLKLVSLLLDKTELSGYPKSRFEKRNHR